MSEKSESEELESFFSKGELLTCIEWSHFLLKKLNKLHIQICDVRIWFKEHKPDLKGVALEEEAKGRRVAFAWCFVLEVGRAWFMARRLFSLELSRTLWLMYYLAAFELQGQSWVVVTDCMAWKLNIFTAWLFTEKICQPLFYTFFIIWICCRWLLTFIMI